MTFDFQQWLIYMHDLRPFKRRIEIARNMRPSPSRFLYKYKAVDEYSPISTDRLRDLLVKSRLWFSSPVDFNDPFDMSAKIVANATGKERLDRVEALLKGLGLSRKEEMRRRKIIMRKPIDVLEKDLETSFKNSVAKMGVFSFAGDAKSILMWSHYAQDHTGICIQFERLRDFKTLAGAVPVEYSSEYPEVNWIKDFRETLKKVMLRKHEGWSYEREYRLLRPEGAHSYLQLDPQAIVGIIFGCRSTIGKRGIIESLLVERDRAGMPPIRLLAAQKHNSQYRLVVLRQ